MLTSLPNILTLSRIAAIPLLLALIYVDTPVYRWVALGGYVMACITDYFDGYLARHMKQISPLGRFLDPIADKLLVASLIVMLVATQQIAGLEMIPAIVILAREILVSGLREYLAEIKVSVPVTKLAKWKTAIQMVALGFLIVGDPQSAMLSLHTTGEIGLWIAGALTALTGYDYMSRGLKHMVGQESGSR